MSDDNAMDGALERLEAPRIDAALAPLRPDPEAFRAGVERRITERAGEERVETTAPTSWPRWARRAAAVLPPGVGEALFASKWSATGGASTAWIAIAFVPWFVLIVAAMLLFALGRRRVVRALQRDLSPRERWAVDSSGVGASVLIVAVVVIGGIAGDDRGIAVALVVLIALFVAVAAVVARGGDRTRLDEVGAALSVLCAHGAFLGAMFLWIGDDSTGSWTPTLLPITLGVGGIAIGAACASIPLRGMLVRIGLAQTAAAALLGVIGTWNADAPRPADPAALRAFAEAFDAPVDDLTAWKQLGTAALALEAIGERGGVATASAARAWRASIDDVEDVHPISALGAVRAGLVGTRDVPGADRRTRRFQDAMRSDRRRPHVLALIDEGDVLDVRALVEGGRIDEDLRARIVEELDAAWPRPGAFRALEHLVHAVEIADALGATELLARRAADVRAALAAAWTGRSSPSEPAGFEANLDDGRRQSARVRSNVEDTLWAVLLMARFGVSDGVDPRRLDAYLATESRRGPYAMAASQARTVLDRAIGVPPWRARDVLRREWPLFAGLLVVALAAVLVARGTRAERRG